MMPDHRRSRSSSENSLPTSSSSYSSHCSSINTTTSSSITPIPTPTPTRQHYSFLDAKPPSLSHQQHRPTANNSSSGASRDSCFGGCFGVKLGLSAFSFMARGDRGQASAVVRRDSGKTGSVQQRRIELEHEVANLQRVLQNEEKVHEVFQHALLPYNGKTSLHIPNSLPKEAKELLEELAMVEEEIARLEGEISKIKQGEANIQEPTRSRPYTRANTNLNSLAHQSLVVPARSLKSSGMQEKVALETKPMFFINQAIKGDYMIHDFGSKEKVRSSLEISKGRTTSRVETSEKRDRQKLVRHQQRISKRSGIMESASSLKLPPMTPIPKTQKTQEINPEFSFNLPQDPSPLSTSIDKGSQRWQSNKLSEQIIKCLICIFLRLLRTSRATELEKSGNLTRSVNLSSRSLQLDGGLSLKAKPKTQRETSQQDPYGIFEFEDSIIRDIGYYKNLVQFTISSLDLKRISTSLPLLSKLRVLMSNLHDIDLRFLTHQQKLAFWINMYNICIMHVQVFLSMVYLQILKKHLH